MTVKACTTCLIEKNISKFQFRTDSNTYRGQCKECCFAIKKIWCNNNKEKISSVQKEYISNNKERVAETLRVWYQKNRDAVLAKQAKYAALHKQEKAARNKKWYQKNKLLLRSGRAKYQRERIRHDPIFKLRARLSTAIYIFLKGGKGGLSITNHLPYSMGELKEHLEKKFESWMNWENYGVYRVNIWDDQESSTWTWQIDHIIPHSKFNYTSIEDKEFRECWALDNLRPYSAKQNVKDGNR